MIGSMFPDTTKKKGTTNMAKITKANGARISRIVSQTIDRVAASQNRGGFEGRLARGRGSRDLTPRTRSGRGSGEGVGLRVRINSEANVVNAATTRRGTMASDHHVGSRSACRINSGTTTPTEATVIAEADNGFPMIADQKSPQPRTSIKRTRHEKKLDHEPAGLK